jgi:hypothetical protein
MVIRGFVRAIGEMARAGHEVITEAVILPNTVHAYLDALVLLWIGPIVAF